MVAQSASVSAQKKFGFPPFGTPRAARGLLPPWYATVPGLRKGNARRCNIIRASPHGCPLSLSGGAHFNEGGTGGELTAAEI